MITEHYWQNTDIRKKTVITTWQFVFSLPHPHQPWRPWTIPIFSVFPQSHGFLDLRSFWLPAFRTSWSKSFIKCNVPNSQIVPAEEREAWMKYLHTLSAVLQSAQLEWCLLFAQEYNTVDWNLIYDPRRLSRLCSAELSHPVFLILEQSFLPVLHLFLSSCLHIFSVHFSNL